MLERASLPIGPALRGPSWTQLIVGSEGTLGVITSARLRVSPAPQLKVFRGFEVDDSVELAAAADPVVDLAAHLFLRRRVVTRKRTFERRQRGAVDFQAVCVRACGSRL